MTTNLMLCAIALVSFLNLISTLFLSNAIFRIFGERPAPPPETENRPVKAKNLVDLKNHPTYDIRFRDD